MRKKIPKFVHFAYCIFLQVWYNSHRKRGNKYENVFIRNVNNVSRNFNYYFISR